MSEGERSAKLAKAFGGLKSPAPAPFDRAPDAAAADAAPEAADDASEDEEEEEGKEDGARPAEPTRGTSSRAARTPQTEDKQHTQTHLS